MLKFYNLLFLIMSFPSYLALGQNIVLNGFVKDAATNIPLPGAAVYVPSLKSGTVADINGLYTIELPTDSIILLFSYTGYDAQEVLLCPKENARLDIHLDIVELEEVIVTANTLLSKVETLQMSTERITAQEAKAIPALGGEVDLIKTLQLKPGIQSGGEGSSGLFVRGGSPDQNLMLLDQAPIYNASHLFGFMSVFNSEAIDNISLYKGGFPAQYGGRLSSVVDIQSRTGNNKKFAGSGGLGLIASRLTLEGPIKKNHSSFIVSARRTYFDTFTRLINEKLQHRPDYDPIPDYYFYDINGKITLTPSPKDNIMISGYKGRDKFALMRNKRSKFDTHFDWGNTAISVQWQRKINKQLSSSLSYIYSDYDYVINHTFDAYYFRVGSSVSSNALKYDFDYAPSHKHNVKVGTAFTYHGFAVARAQASNKGDHAPYRSGKDFFGSEFGAYVSDDYSITNQLKINTGVRISGFTYKETTYTAFEPRLAARYMIGEATSFKASYSRMNQYLHLVSSSGASLPIDIWYPSTEAVKPEKSDQLAVGFSTLVLKKKVLINNEVYYKTLSNQIDYKDGANLIVNNHLENEFVYGIGRSYGNEFYVEKKAGKTTGWIGYTLSWSWRQFADINEGKRFFPRHDRRHDVSMVIMHKLSTRLIASGSWVYSSGNAISLPLGRTVLNDVPGKNAMPESMSIYPQYGERNNFRMASYHRLDLGLIVKLSPRWGDADLTFSIYNTYNRLNPYFIYFEKVTENPDGTGDLKGFKAKQVSLFPIIPSVTYNFKF